MINGLDLFSGYGGISLALRDWVRPIVFCEIERYSQGILLSRMSEGLLPVAPIWDDVSTLGGSQFWGRVDIVYGGFPCQDISVAGNGAGLAGKRSGLFFEVCRLVEEIQPTFVFLENVPAIRTRGLREVIRALTNLRYDCRWTRVSANEIGAPHKRERWFLLGRNTASRERQTQSGIQEKQNSNTGRICHSIPNSECEQLRDEQGRRSRASGQGEAQSRDEGTTQPVANTCIRRCMQSEKREVEQSGRTKTERPSWWATEPDVGRVVDGCAFRVDRIKALGNGVVPLQAKVAFERLMGLEGK